VSSRRTLIVIVAVVIGAIASFALFQYTDGAEDRAYGKARRVTVLVVKKDIPKSFLGADAVQQGYVGEALIPQEFRPATALTTTAGLEALVAKGDLSAGQVVVDGMFVTPDQAYSTNAERLAEGMVAITISIDQVRGVAGLIVPGDRVNMIIDHPTQGFIVDDVRKPVKTVLYQNVKILAVGTQLEPDLGEAVVAPGSTAAPETVASNLLTLEVPLEAATRIAYVGSEGLYLTLVPPNNAPVERPGIGPENLVTTDLTPYGNDEL
jgi:pilus assembly protein CpaB